MKYMIKSTVGVLLVVALIFLNGCTSHTSGPYPTRCDDGDPDTLFQYGDFVILESCTENGDIDTLIIENGPNIDECIELCLKLKPRGKKHVLECVRRCVSE